MPTKVADIKPASYNPRKITKRQLEALGKAMKEFGDLSGIVVNTTTGHLVGGHQRLKHLDQSWAITMAPMNDSTGTVGEGWIQTPWGRISYRQVSWTIEKEKAANIAANAHGGEFELDLLKPMIAEMKIANIDLDLTGLEQTMLDKLLPSEDFPKRDDHIISRTKPGYVWQLGRHTLLCADAGTTLMAAERTGKTGICTEKEPGYCDFIIKMWEQKTGQKAHLVTGA